MQKIIVILGATATGKSTLAAKLAIDLNAEIINTDAYQVYKELNAGVNKTPLSIRKKIPHHFIDSHSIYDEFDIKIFQDLAREKIKEISNRKKTIIVTGGSNLYLESLIKNYELDKARDRKNISFFDHMSYDEIYDYLYENDPEEAVKINKNNKRRIIRAAQLFYETKQTKKQQNKNNKLIYDVFFINTILDREYLYNKIDDRVEQMINNNWVQEVKKLYEFDNNITNLQAFKAIGYNDILNAIINNKNIDIENIKKLTRNYAKRQITWNKRYDKIDININNYNHQELVDKIKLFLEK